MDFKEGPQIIPDIWLTPDRKSCAWPTWAAECDQVTWDKRVREGHLPEKDWTEEPVLRERVSGSNFPYVRGKLKLAEDNSDTDLRTDDEEHTNGRKLRNRKTHRTVCDSWVDESSKMDLPKFPSGNSESNGASSSDSAANFSRVGKVNARSSTLGVPKFPEDNDDSNGVSLPSLPAKFSLSRKNQALSEVVSSAHSTKSFLLEETVRDFSNTEPSIRPLVKNLTSKEVTCNDYASHSSEVVPFAHSTKSSPLEKPKGTLQHRDSSFPSDADIEKEILATKFLTTVSKSDVSMPSESGDKSGKISVKKPCADNTPDKTVDAMVPTNCSSENGSNNRGGMKRSNESDFQTPAKRISTANQSTSMKDKALHMAFNMTEAEFKAYVISALIQVKSRLGTLPPGCRQCQQPASKSVLSTGETNSLAVLTGLPADCFMEWEALEKKLESSMYCSALVTELKRYSDGTDVGSTVRAVLSRVLSNRCGTLFSLHGTKHKRIFKTTKFYESVLPRVIKDIHPNTPVPIVQKAAENWFRLAGQRKGGLSFKKWSRSSRSSPEEKPKETNPEETPKETNPDEVNTQRKRSKSKKSLFQTDRSSVSDVDDDLELISDAESAGDFSIDEADGEAPDRNGCF